MGLTVTIQERAQERGIENANQLGVALGVAPNVSARLWSGEFEKLGMNTFEKLCEVFECQPNTLFRYEGLIRKAPKKTVNRR
jgi:DNA-binding Xre family transcriptional regulator